MVEAGHSVHRHRHASPRGAFPGVASVPEEANTAVASAPPSLWPPAATSHGSDEKSTTPRSNAAVTFLIIRMAKPDSGSRELVREPVPHWGGTLVLVLSKI